MILLSYLTPFSFIKDLKILKFKDLLHLQNCLFVLQIEQNETLAKSFVTLNIGNNHKTITTHTKCKCEFLLK